MRLPEPPPNCISRRATVIGRDQPVEDASDPAICSGGCSGLETQTIRQCRITAALELRTSNCNGVGTIESDAGGRKYVRYALVTRTASSSIALGQHRYHAPSKKQAAMSIIAQSLDILLDSILLDSLLVLFT